MKAATKNGGAVMLASFVITGDPHQLASGRGLPYSHLSATVSLAWLTRVMTCDVTTHIAEAWWIGECD